MKAASLIAFALVYTFGGPVWAQDARDADIFGSPSGTEDARSTESTPLPSGAPAANTSATASGAPAADESAMFGGAPSGDGQPRLDTESLPGRVAEKENVLAIGGLLYQRMSYTYNRGAVAGKAPLSAPSLYDLYADARPSDRVRAYARARLRYDFTAPSSSGSASASTAATTNFGSFTRAPKKVEGSLDQLWLKFDVERAVFVTVGKQPLKWGTGRFWNPTDFLNPQRRDPLAVFDERLGVSLIKLHVPLEATGTNFFLIGDVEDAATPEQVGLAARAEQVVGTAEFAISGEARKNRPSVLGADFSWGVWDLDVRGEAAFANGDQGPFYRGSFRPAELVLPREVDRSGEWIPQVVGGLEYAFNYSDEDSVSLGVEYFWNDAGYTHADFYPWLLFNGAFRPLYLGREYAAAYVYLAGPGDWNDTSFIVTGLSNLSDGSYLSRFDYRVLLLTYVNFDVYVNYHFGENGELNYGLRVPPVAFVPQLRNGLSTPQPLVDGGVGLRVAF